jgi:hypothetical protein
VTDNPASDYLFVGEQHPVPVHTPDLDAQLDQFLALPPTAEASLDTLWIFSFGTWDVWKLAAMPLQSGEKVVDAVSAHMFNKIEFLYRKSLDPRTTAFSDFWSNSTEEEFKELTDFDAAATVDKRTLESFRILIPQLLDVSLTPGWHNRVSPSVPHSSAEQTRNSALLTERWNSKIRQQMDDWNNKGQASPEGMENDNLLTEIGVAPKAPFFLENQPSILRETNPDKEKPFDANVVYVPFPQRLGLHSKSADAILETMMEEDMERAGAVDSQGRGASAEGDVLHFSDVWTPCIPSNPRTSEDSPERQQLAECKVPDQHLFYTPFTVGQRTIDEVVRRTADAIWEGLIVPPTVSGKS